MARWWRGRFQQRRKCRFFSKIYIHPRNPWRGTNRHKSITWLH